MATKLPDLTEDEWNSLSPLEKMEALKHQANIDAGKVPFYKRLGFYSVVCPVFLGLIGIYSTVSSGYFDASRRLLQAEKVSLETDKKLLNQDKLELEVSKSRLEQENMQLQAKEQTLREKEQALSVNITEHQEQLDSMNMKAASIAELQQQLTEKQMELEAMRKAKASEAQLVTLQNENAALNSRIESLKEQLASIKSNQTTLARSQKALLRNERWQVEEGVSITLLNVGNIKSNADFAYQLNADGPTYTVYNLDQGDSIARENRNSKIAVIITVLETERDPREAATLEASVIHYQ